MRNILPPVPDDCIRLWRGNRLGEVGKNPSFTNKLEGIALPFFKQYGGVLSFVDMPKDMISETLLTDGVAKDSEFELPSELASQALAVDEDMLGISSEALKLCLEYASWNNVFNKESFKKWLIQRRQ